MNENDQEIAKGKINSLGQKNTPTLLQWSVSRTRK